MLKIILQNIYICGTAFAKHIVIMKNLLTSTSLIAVTLISFSSCSPKIAGTWNIANYESKSPNGQEIKVANIGTIDFKRNKTGVKKINYSLFENKVEDNTGFKWNKEKEGGSITITSDGSQLNKTWIIVKSQRKYQQWKSTDGSNTVQVLELKKSK